MSEALAALVDVSAALAAGDEHEIEATLRAAAGLAETVQIEEALLQSHLFLGYPAALRGLAVWRRISGVPAPDGPAGDRHEWERRGEATCARVYGDRYERLRQNVAALHPDMEQWMVTDGYGRVLGRPGLDLVTREACVVAVLASQDAAAQLYAHLRGALNAGADEDLIERVVRRLLPRLSSERAAVLVREWAAVRTRRAGARTRG